MTTVPEFSVDSVFGEGGLLAAKFPGYRPRSGQVDMARAIEEALANRRHLIVEAGTGVGKSVGYLVPAIAHAIAAKKRAKGRLDDGSSRVVVVTANIALQEQLMTKDLPALASVLPEPFSFAMLKGRNNYLCVDALGKVLGDVGTREPQMKRLLVWAQETKTGDVSEFPETPVPGSWRRLAVGSDECKGSACKFRQQCFSERARASASAADVVVTNYHLFFAHLVVRQKMKEIRASGGAVDLDVVIPAAQTIVFDEAHKAADIARDFLGFQVSRGQVDWLLNGFNYDLAAETRREALRFFDAALELKKSKRYRARLRRGHGLDGDALASCLERVSKYFRESIAATAWTADEVAELTARARRSAAIAANIREATGEHESADVVYFLEEAVSGRDRVPTCALKSKPIEIAAWAKKELFESFSSVVLTSATLATSTDRPFAFVRKEIGLEGGGELVAASPFRWDQNAMLVVPRTTADPKDREAFPASVAEHVRAICEAAGGRTLALFTSYRNLQAAFARCEDLPFRVMRQGDLPRTKLVAEFRADVASCLLGCESFWAGVDCPGETLSCVVIDRLPFPTPDDPIADALAERSGNSFFTHSVPRAIIAVKQAAGRLIRSETDRGCVVILDRRVTESSYGRAFVKALPRMRIADEIDDVAAFLGTRSSGTVETAAKRKAGL